MATSGALNCLRRPAFAGVPKTDKRSYPPVEMSARLFVAIDVPDSHVDALRQLEDTSLEARWTPAHQFHLTLRFIGDVDEGAVDAIRSTLASVPGAMLTVRAGGLDVFPSRRRPRVLVVPVEADSSLVRLQRAIDGRLHALGIEPDSRPFNPHITVARLTRASPQSVRGYLRTHASFSLPPFEVDAFYLYESTLSSTGAVHERIGTFSLAPA